MQIVLLALYCTVLLVLCTYGAHRASLVFQCLRYQRRIERTARSVSVAESELPTVTVQLPLYNEATVVRRLLDAAGALDYPSDRLELQVLDDSTDETEGIARAAVEELRERGVNAVYLRRPDRHGYKAGALDFGLQQATGELIAIFDADFVPQASFLKEIVGHFSDPRIGMVQTRWQHMNRDHSLLTSIQALMLDGHHMVENRARFGAGNMFNFSGTGGMWRRQAIQDAGGWEHDTLTEDLDLSYRAQLAGWRFLVGASCTVRTCSRRPSCPRTCRRSARSSTAGPRAPCRPRAAARAGRQVGAELGAAHRGLLSHVAAPSVPDDGAAHAALTAALLFMPASDVRTLLLIDLPLCIGATGSLATFYAMAELAQGRSAWGAMKRLPALIALGAGSLRTSAPRCSTACARWPASSCARPSAASSVAAIVSTPSCPPPKSHYLSRRCSCLAMATWLPW